MINRKKISNRAAYIVLALIFTAMVLTTALEILISSADMKIIDISQSSGDNEVELICLLTEDYRDSRSGFIYDSGTLMTVYIDSEKFFKRELGIDQNVRFYTTKTVEEPMGFTRFRAFGLKKYPQRPPHITMRYSTSTATMILVLKQQVIAQLSL